MSEKPTKTDRNAKGKLRKLRINKETLKDLSASASQNIRGGAPNNPADPIYSDSGCASGCGPCK